MKKYSFLLIFLLGFSTTFFGQGDDGEPTCTCVNNCEDFENNSKGNWKTDNTPIKTTTTTSPLNTYLEFDDGNGDTWGYNTEDYDGDYSMGQSCLCWDFKIFNEGYPDWSETVNPKISIFNGFSPSSSTLLATFVSTLSITENDDWVRVCAPLTSAQNQQLPSNNGGSWQEVTPAQWNDLIANVNGIGFNVDVAGSDSVSEEIGVDNICLCLFDCNTLAPSYFTSDANGIPKQEFCYGEDVYININTVDYPYSATYLDTWLDPNYQMDQYNSAGWNWDVFSGIYNYSQILRDKGERPFELITDYYIKLAVDHPDCGWIESYASFSYVCCDQAPAFITTDAYGNPKQEFCYGEDVFIQINTVDYPYSATYLDTWLDPNYQMDQYNSAGWNWDVFSGIYNYSQILRDKGERPFDPVDNYYIKLAVDHPDCGWIDSHASFSYVCCEDDNFALFNANINSSEGTVSGGGQDLSGYGATHSYCIYTDSNNDGVFEILDCSSSPNFSFPIQDGVEYWIVHRVFTLCGDYCYVINFTTSPGFGMDSSSSLDCDNFPPPCNLTTPLAKCPFKIIGNTGVELRLNWNSVPSATNYEVDVVYDDAACGCSNSGEGSTQSGKTSGTKFDIPISSRDMCFSYKVRARCQDGSFSNWSDPICYPNCLYSFHSATEDSSNRNDMELTTGKFDLFPNPFSYELNISLSGFESDQVAIQITNLQGQLIKIDYINPKLNDNYAWRPSQEITQGVYLVTLTSDDYRETKKAIYTK